MSVDPIAPSDWIWRIVVRVMMASPRKTKLGVAVYVLSALFSIVVAIANVSKPYDPQELGGSLGVIVGSIGMVVVGIGYLLHSENQRACNDLRALRFERPWTSRRSRRTRRSVTVTPILFQLEDLIYG